MGGGADGQEVVVEQFIGEALERMPVFFWSAPETCVAASAVALVTAASMRANCCPPRLPGGKSAGYFTPKAEVVLKVASRLVSCRSIVFPFSLWLITVDSLPITTGSRAIMQRRMPVATLF
jgi:hypothetical protein